MHQKGNDRENPKEITTIIEGMINAIDVITTVPDQGVLVGIRLLDLPDHFEKDEIYEAHVDVEFGSRKLSFHSDICIESKRFDPSIKKMFRTILVIIPHNIRERELAGGKIRINVKAPRKYISEQFAHFKSAVSSRAKERYARKNK